MNDGNYNVIKNEKYDYSRHLIFGNSNFKKSKEWILLFEDDNCFVKSNKDFDFLREEIAYRFYNIGFEEFRI